MVDVTNKLKERYPFEIKHYPSGKVVKLKSFIKDFSDSHKSEWSADTNAFSVGPTVVAQKSVTRSITVSLDIPAFNLQEAKQNLEHMQYLAKFMYPSYRGGRIWTSTFLGVRFANWINFSKGFQGKGAGTTDGFLPVYIEDFTFNPVMKPGHFIEPGNTLGVNSTIYPKLIELSLTMNAAALNMRSTSYNSDAKEKDSPWVNYPYFADLGADSLVKTHTATGETEELALELGGQLGNAVGNFLGGVGATFDEALANGLAAAAAAGQAVVAEEISSMDGLQDRLAVEFDRALSQAQKDNSERQARNLALVQAARARAAAKPVNTNLQQAAKQTILGGG